MGGMFAEQSTPGAPFEWDAETIRALRKYLGWSQSALARELGIRQQTVSEWETGVYRPRGASVTILNLLARTAGFDASTAGETEREADRLAPARARGPLLAASGLLAAGPPAAIPGLQRGPGSSASPPALSEPPPPFQRSESPRTTERGRQDPSFANVRVYSPGEEVPM